MKKKKIFLLWMFLNTMVVIRLFTDLLHPYSRAPEEPHKMTTIFSGNFGGKVKDGCMSAYSGT